MSYQLDNISHIVRNNGLIILVGIFFSPVIVGLISTVKTLFYFLPIRFLDIFNNSVFLEFSKMYGKKEIVTAKKFFKSHIYINIFVLTVFSVLSLFLGKIVYEFWTSNKYDISTYLLILIIIDTVMFNFYNSIEIFIKSINKFFFSAMVKAFLSIISIITTFILFSNGYSFHIYFLINIISSIIILIFVSSITLKTFNNYK